VSNNALADVFPDKIKPSAGDYKSGELAVFLKDKKISPEKLSEEDIQNLINVIPENIKEEKILYQAEEKINFIKLHKVKEEFQRLVEQRTDTDRLEEKCQSFFTDNHWILSNILSMPVVLLGGKVYVGGKSIQNRGGKEADFLFKNKLTKNVFPSKTLNRPKCRGAKLDDAKFSQCLQRAIDLLVTILVSENLGEAFGFKVGFRRKLIWGLYDSIEF
jgi:hypothetical protein